ncbi:Endosulfine-domain-containing protein [Jaminaea rosea]|uniref:mRNA stability protein n=1 Tax=Jaminaea rosea TaxID=1569628 RepID=A0A316UT50_9BASI|nr:Endosulfine-domain-containing protein [Jaminaea rosea]PWN28174.1 Endosulfine-domain-containing protein [Jaminaea rosea]
MLPAQRNKVDINSLTEEEQKLFRLYGKLPNRKDVIGNKLKERKYFDSGDYALSKAGKAPQQSVGTAIPNPESIPHASTVGSPPPPGMAAVSGSSPTNTPGSSFPQESGSASSGTMTSNPINVPMPAAAGGQTGGAGQCGGAGPALPHLQRPNQSAAVSSFPTATGAAGSPQGKEGSSLGREEIKADDVMMED